MQYMTVEALFGLWIERYQSKISHTPQVKVINPNHLLITFKDADPNLEFRLFFSGMVVTYTIESHRKGKMIYPLKLMLPYKFHTEDFKELGIFEKKMDVQKFMIEKVASMCGDGEFISTNLARNRHLTEEKPARFSNYNRDYVKYVLGEFKNWASLNIQPDHFIVASQMKHRGNFRKLDILPKSQFPQGDKYIVGPVLIT
jgi:hypothetical protein